MRLTGALQCYQKLPKTYANFPEKFIKKQTEFVEWKPPRRPNYNHRITIRWRNSAYYDRFRSWTPQFQSMNGPGIHHPKIWIEPIERFFIFKGDRVEVLKGKDKGKQGIVSYTVPERNWAFVQGLNLRRIIKDIGLAKNFVNLLEKPLLVPSEVALVDPSDKQPTTIKWKYDEDGNIVRVSDRTGRIIFIPKEAFQTYDYITPDQYVESKKDTKSNKVVEVTFTPEVKTFEMDIMEQYGLKEDRIPYKTYWF